jgi:outer membrane protein assembly factor BamB
MLRLRPTTGETVWQGDLPVKTKFQASPTGADGKIYCLSMNGEAVVLSAADGEVLHQAEMGGKGVRASVAVADGQLFIRTDAKVYCIGRRR